MLVRLTRDRVNAALPALEIFAAGVIAISERGTVPLVGVAFLVAGGLYGWLRSVRHARLILDTPTARIASAAQGYAELRGRGRPLAGTPVRSPINGLPVLWYRATTEQRDSDGKWQRISSCESDSSFLLQDDSGVCAVDPEGAEMLIRRREVFRRGDLRHTQWCIIERDPIYVIGEFSTLGSIAPEFDIAGQVRELLAHWKNDRHTLLQRFDLDGNGEIDLREWELARAQAKREVLKRRSEVLSAPEAHVMRAPGDKRLYLISDLDPAGIAKRYRLWAAFHLLIFLGAVAGGGWLHQTGAF